MTNVFRCIYGLMLYYDGPIPIRYCSKTTSINIGNLLCYTFKLRNQ